MNTPTSSSLIRERAAAVDSVMARIREQAAGRAVSRELLADIAATLQCLADQPHFFTEDAFPGPDDAQGSGIVRYLLAAQPDDSFALYLNSIDAGKSSPPHDHTTWAVIVALEGEELNRLYDRVDDGSDAARARLQQRGEFLVRRGHSIQFMPDDIHSIHILGEKPTRHFHLYGRALERLDERVGYNLETGEVVKFNKNFMDPPRIMPR